MALLIHLIMPVLDMIPDCAISPKHLILTLTDIVAFLLWSCYVRKFLYFLYDMLLAKLKDSKRENKYLVQTILSWKNFLLTRSYVFWFFIVKSWLLRQRIVFQTSDCLNEITISSLHNHVLVCLRPRLFLIQHFFIVCY